MHTNAHHETRYTRVYETISYVCCIAGRTDFGRLGQTDKQKFMTPNKKSPPMQTAVTINGKEIWISYHAPSVNGRKIFGGSDALQPDDTIWRAGADQATFLHTDADLDINGVTCQPANIRFS